MDSDPEDQIIQYLEAKPPEALEPITAALRRTVIAEQERILDVCKHDAWYFVHNFCHSVNLHFEDNALSGGGYDQTIDLFPAYPHIISTIEAMQTPSNTLIEKSRDMMATWMCCSIFLWDLMFQEGCQLLMASRIAANVDDGGEGSTPESLLGRVKFMYDYLPDWMRAESPFSFKRMQIQNTAKGNVLVGMKAQKHTGRQGKYRRALADEFGHWDYAESNLAAMGPAAQNGLILLSTPSEEGRLHAFGRLCEAGAPGFKHIKLHWSQHPNRQGKIGDAWYKAFTASMTADQIARELEMEHDAAISGKFFPMFDRDTHVLDEIPFNPKVPLHLTFDHGQNEETAIFVQVHGKCPGCGEPFYYVIDYYQGGFDTQERKTTPWEVRDWIIDEMLTQEPYNLVVDQYDVIQGLGYCTGDAAGNVDSIPLQGRKIDDQKSTSFHAVYAQRGIKIRSKFSKVKDGIGIMQSVMTGCSEGPHFFVAEKCRLVWDAMIHYRRRRNPADRSSFLPNPVHDWTSHPTDAVRYYFVNTTSVMRLKRKHKQKYRRVWTPGITGARRPQLIPVDD